MSLISLMSPLTEVKCCDWVLFWHSHLGIATSSGSLDLVGSYHILCVFSKLKSGKYWGVCGEISHCERMLNMKDMNTLLFNTASLVNGRSKFPLYFSFFFTRPCRSPESIFVEDQVEDLPVILWSEFTCGISNIFEQNYLWHYAETSILSKQSFGFFFSSLSPSSFSTIWMHATSCFYLENVICVCDYYWPFLWKNALCTIIGQRY